MQTLNSQIPVLDTCAADGSYAVLIQCEAAADGLLTHVFVELIATSEIEQCTVELVARHQSINRLKHINHTYLHH